MTTNDDVFQWVSDKESEYVGRAITVLACRELVALGWSYREIAQALGVSRQWVARALTSQASQAP